MNASLRRSLTGAHWVPAALPDPRPIARAGLHPVVQRVAAIRGFDLDAGWLTPSPDHLHDPHAMHGMDAAADRFAHAAREGHRLRVITDYDVDGTTSSLILQAALQRTAPSVTVDYHIPDRFTEGYGFSVAAAERAAADGIDLIVTADIGVRDHAAVRAARAAGVDVIVCDHHLPPGADVPDDCTVLCPPQARCAYPNPHLAACGVSLKLAEVLLSGDPKRDPILGSLAKLAAIGTVADLVPLATLENRAIVHRGLEQLNRGRHGPGLTALLEVAGARPGEIDEQTLGWQLAPRINAAGRLAHATLVVELLTTRDPATAARLAHELDALNRERREVQKRLVDTVLAGLDDPPPFVVAAGPEHEGWHRGVVGIVAARVKDEVHRPAAVVSIQGDRAVGSVRCPPGVHAVRALDSASDLLERYGGHPAAAGFSLPADRLDALRERLSAYADQATHDPDDVSYEVDAEIAPDALTDTLLAQLRQLAPFGQANPEPRLVVRGAVLDGVRAIGRDRTHLKARLRGTPVEVVWWKQAAHADAVVAGPVDLLGALSENRWQGRRTLQFVVRDARPAEV